MCGGGGGGGDKSAEREAQRQAEQDAAINRINKVFGIGSPSNRAARENLYENNRSSVHDYYSNELNDQRANADRQARFDLARRGVVGGSSDIDTNAGIQRDYNRATLDIGNRADTAATRLKTNDEQARLDLINRIRAGLSGGDAIKSAYSQLESNARAAKTNAVSDSLGQVFKNIGGVVNNQSTSRGRNRAYEESNGTFVNANPASYSGRSN